MINGQEYKNILNLFSVLDLEAGERKGIELPSKQEVINQVISLYNKEKSSRQLREGKWREYFNAYNLRPSLPEPINDWQSKTIIPKYFYLVEQFASVIRRSLIQSGKFFSLFTLREDLRNLAIALERLASYYLNSFSFLSEFEKAVKIGAITGEIILECSWQREFHKIGGRLRVKEFPKFQALSPFDLIIDSSTLRRYMIKRYYMPIETAFTLQEIGYFEKFPLQYNPPSTSENLDETLQKSFIDFTPKEGYIEVLEFIGNLYYKEKIYEDMRILIANRQYLARVEMWDSWDKELPIVKTHLYPAVKGEYGYGLFDVVYDTLRSLNILVRFIEDWVYLSLGHIIEIDKTKLDEETASKLEKGFQPFTIILKNSPDPVVQVSTLAQFNPNVLPLLQYHQQEIQNGTGLTEYIMGLPTSKGRPTAREIMIKTQQSGAVLDSIAIRIENEIIEKIIHKLLILIIQNEKAEKIQQILGSDFEYLKPFFTSEEAKQELALLLKEEIGIRVDGITQTLHRREQIENLLEFLTTAIQLPVANEINYKYYLERLSYLFGFTSRETIREPTQEEIQKQDLNEKGLILIAKLSLENPELAKSYMELIKNGVPPYAILQAYLLEQQEKQQQAIMKQQQQQKQEEEEEEE
jgi:hypothetical protein